MLKKDWRKSRVPGLVTATIVLMVCLQVNGQVRDLSFDPPFRLKHVHWFETADGWGESWAVGGNGGLHVKTLQSQRSAKISKVDLNSLFFIDNQTAFVAGNSGELLLTRDRGKTWAKQESGTGTNLQSLYCVDKDNCWAAGDKDGIILKGGIDKKWTLENVVSNGRFTDIYFANKDIGYAAGRDGLFIKTENGGKTWMRINIPSKLAVSEFIDGVPYFESVVFKNADVGCVAGWDVGTGVIACTQNGGDTWHVNIVEATPIGIVWSSGDEISVVDRYGQNLISRDLGKSWTRRAKK